MSKEAVDRFMAAWGDKDPKIIEAMKAQSQDVVDELSTIVSVANELGYDVTEQDVIDASNAHRRKSLQVAQDDELSDDELKEVAGGASWNGSWPQPCSSDYDPNSRCVFNDRCLSTWHYYRAKQRCYVTFEDDEACFQDDRCTGNNWRY